MFQTLLVFLILTGIAKLNLVRVTFLFCGEIVKNSITSWKDTVPTLVLFILWMCILTRPQFLCSLNSKSSKVDNERASGSDSGRQSAWENRPQDVPEPSNGETSHSRPGKRRQRSLSSLEKLDIDFIGCSTLMWTLKSTIETYTYTWCH